MKAAAMVNTHTHARLLRFIAILPIRNGREYSALPRRTAIRIYRNPCPIFADALDCCWQSMLEFAPAFGALRVLDFLRRVFLLWPQKASCKIKKGLRFLGALFLVLILAVTYVPASFPTQYHRPCEA